MSGFGQETSSPERPPACILWAGLGLSGSMALARIAFLLLSDPQGAAYRAVFANTLTTLPP